MALYIFGCRVGQVSGLTAQWLWDSEVRSSLDGFIEAFIHSQCCQASIPEEQQLLQTEREKLTAFDQTNDENDFSGVLWCVTVDHKDSLCVLKIYILFSPSRDITRSVFQMDGLKCVLLLRIWSEEKPGTRHVCNVLCRMWKSAIILYYHNKGQKCR